MSWLPWALVAALVIVVCWLLLALHGASRRIEELAAAAQVRHLSAGIEPGSRAPAFTGTGPDGAPFASEELAGMRHLLLFADPDCRSCAELVPDVLGAARARRVPFVTLVSRGEAGTHPPAWRGSPRSRLVIEDGAVASDAFGVDVTPTAFVVDEGGWVVARDLVESMHDVEGLVAEASGVRIVGGGSGDG